MMCIQNPVKNLIWNTETSTSTENKNDNLFKKYFDLAQVSIATPNALKYVENCFFYDRGKQVKTFYKQSTGYLIFVFHERLPWLRYLLLNLFQVKITFFHIRVLHRPMESVITSKNWNIHSQKLLANLKKLFLLFP